MKRIARHQAAFTARARTTRHSGTLFSRLRLLGMAGAAILAIATQTLGASALEAGFAMYRVRPGETLGGIAASLGVPTAHLAGLNRLQDPNRILAGQDLRVPASANIAASGTGLGIYVVRPGDTLLRIASNSDISAKAVIAANQLPNPDRLVVGQQLRLPSTASPSVAAPVAPSAAGAQAAPAPLRARVLSEIRRVGGSSPRVGVFARRLDTGEQLAIRADETFPSASVMKLPILVEVQRQLASGALDRTDAVRADLTAMMVVSDNTAANRLVDLVGEAQVNGTMASLGLPNTRLENPFSSARSAADAGRNRTTPADMARLLELIATDRAVSPQASSEVRALLERNTDSSKLMRLLPAGTRVAHKSGWYDGVAGDVGVVTVPATGARWTVAVLTEGIPDGETGNQLIAAVSRAIYDGWAAAR